MDDGWLWSDWRGVVRIAVMGVLAYTALIVLLRASGKRTLSKMNAFDFVVTVAIGSTLATILLDRSIPLAEGVVAFAMLVGLQYGVAFVSTRSDRFQSLVKSRPTVLVWRGRMLHDAMRRARVTEAEILAACREQGVASLDAVHAMVLETAGELSILSGPGAPPALEASTLRTARLPDATPATERDAGRAAERGPGAGAPAPRA